MSGFELNKFLGATLGALVFIMGLSVLSEIIFEEEPPEQKGYVIAVAEPTEGEPEEPQEEPISVLLASSDVAAGARNARMCGACHSLDAGGANKIGPGLHGVVGRPIASHEGFSYSGALKEHAAEDPQWSYDQLDGFLENPQGWVPGTIMGFAGIKDPQDRANVIAYLASPEVTPEAPAFPEPPADAAGGDAAAEAPADGASAGGAPQEAADGGDTAAAVPAEGASAEGATQGAAAGGNTAAAAPAEGASAGGAPQDAAAGGDTAAAARAEGASAEGAPPAAEAAPTEGATTDAAAPAAADGTTEDVAATDAPSAAAEAAADEVVREGNPEGAAGRDVDESGEAVQDVEEAAASEIAEGDTDTGPDAPIGTEGNEAETDPVVGEENRDIEGYIQPGEAQDSDTPNTEQAGAGTDASPAGATPEPEAAALSQPSEAVVPTATSPEVGNEDDTVDADVEVPMEEDAAPGDRSDAATPASSGSAAAASGDDAPAPRTAALADDTASPDPATNAAAAPSGGVAQPASAEATDTPAAAAETDGPATDVATAPQAAQNPAPNDPSRRANVVIEKAAPEEVQIINPRRAAQ